MSGYGSIEQINGTSVVPSKTKASQRNQFGIAVAVIAAVMVLIFAWRTPRDVNDVNGTSTGVINGYDNSTSDEALYYTEQLVDHDDPISSPKYAQKYYEKKDYFGNAGSPIFVIIGGEDPLEGILYPFISEYLAKNFSAYTMCIEHRFYGTSQPFEDPNAAHFRKYLSIDQALKDAVQLIQAKQVELGCGPRGSSHYCPVMTVGGSYPGFLSALLRFVYPDVVDIGYASSAPLSLYSHEVPAPVYYDKISQVAEEAAPGCSAAVKSTLLQTQDHILSSSKSVAYLAATYGICMRTIPAYIQTNEMFSKELMMIIATHFAEANMEYYPPDSSSELFESCQIFQTPEKSPQDKIAAFLRMSAGSQDCFDLVSELPPGPNSTISASDWSGAGGDPSAWKWEFTSCELVPELTFSPESMFPARNWTLQWFTDHCEARFGYKPDPSALKNRYGFDDLSDASRLLFTNGLNDGWSDYSVLVPPQRTCRGSEH